MFLSIEEVVFFPPGVVYVKGKEELSFFFKIIGPS
jgi:hypothetical protein